MVFRSASERASERGAVGGSCPGNAEPQHPRHTRGQDTDELKLFVVSKVAIIVHGRRISKLASAVSGALQSLTQECIFT